ncbi:metallophosphoesterase [Phosphitispora fastidiosa]|uniref:metallophosphoesterase n=1 Tax=Phosphitispora fastidiosa TaxID=2837202 RepID=UPI001E418B9B|nr:metallophosphoesterase [Phosphitispora fastidiosa]MBU7007229.1 putative MPP superfamily phosphohydrolase [Phosphitispora fastidiosa]
MPILKAIWRVTRFILQSVLTTGLIVALLVFYAAQIEPDWVQEKEQPVYIERLPEAFEGFRIVQLSDLHGKLFPEKGLVSRVNALKPDLVVITGDVFDESNETPLGYAENALGGLNAPYGVYYVYGNNDTYLGLSKIKRALEQLDIKTLNDEKLPLQVKGQAVSLIGLNYTRTYQDTGDFADLLHNEGEAVIALAHRPEIIDAAAKAGVDLVLAGHTHGGQIKSPYMPDFLHIVKKGYEKYMAGLFKVGETQMYVNRGLGVNNIPLRFLTRPEITVITLHAENQ